MKNASIGELLIAKILNSKKIKYIYQYRLKEYSKSPYDFYFRLKRKKYLLEYDGLQHFQRYHKSYENFFNYQNRDRIKTFLAIKLGYHMIRIDYTQKDKLSYHITKAIKQENILYLSIPKLYKYITKIDNYEEFLKKFL